MPPQDDALQELRTVGEACRLIIESLCPQCYGQLAIGPHRCLIFLQPGHAVFSLPCVRGLSCLVLITKHVHLRPLHDREIDVAPLGVCQRRTDVLFTAPPDFFQVCFHNMRSAESGPLQVRLVEEGSLQVRLVQSGVLQMGLVEVRPLQMRPTQVGLLQTGPTEIAFLQIRLAQVGLLQMRLAQVDFLHPGFA